jgi:hypothetical protein
MNNYFTFLLGAMTLLILLAILPNPVFGQLERKLADDTPKVVELTFDAPRVVTFYTVESLPRKEFHVSIMHNFGTVDNGARNLFGLDNGANVRLGFEYGISDKLSAFVGRSSLDKMLDGGFRYALLKQTKDNKMPVSLSLMGAAGFTAAEYRFIANPGYSTSDRWSSSFSVLIARKFSEKFSLQVAPLYVNFSRVGPERNLDGLNTAYFSVVNSARLKVTRRTSLTAQFAPSFDNQIRNNIGLGVDIETGGHVFQIFFINNPSFNDMYLLAGQNGDIGAGQYRLGFNVNRTFAIR